MKKISIICFFVLSGCATHLVSDGVCIYDQYGGGKYKDMEACKQSEEFQAAIKNSKFKKEILKGSIIKGMSIKELYQSWGKPIEVNEYLRGRKKQHVYKGNQYVYTLDGKVTNWQDL